MKIIEDARPSTIKIVNLIQPSFSEDRDQRILEERVIQFLEEWITSLTLKQLADLMVFWTASNVLVPNQKFIVEFNSLEGMARRPTASTCTDTLNLSRMYMHRQEFVGDMNIVFMEESKIFDAL